MKKVQELGKHFKWKHPGTCPACGSSRLWGHGFALRFFFGFACGLWMKRWRCPDCKAVHTSRPEGFLLGMQYPRQVQQESLEAKLAGKPFLRSIARQPQQHWWKTFLTLCRETANWEPPRRYLKKKLENGQLPVSKRRIYHESRPTADTPYLPFAVTVQPRPFNLE